MNVCTDMTTVLQIVLVLACFYVRPAHGNQPVVNVYDLSLIHI